MSSIGLFLTRKVKSKWYGTILFVVTMLGYGGAILCAYQYHGIVWWILQALLFAALFYHGRLVQRAPDQWESGSIIPVWMFLAVALLLIPVTVGSVPLWAILWE